MSEAESKEKSSDKIGAIVVIAVFVAVVVLGGMFMYNNSKQKTVSVNLGGKEISATFRE